MQYSNSTIYVLTNYPVPRLTSNDACLDFQRLVFILVTIHAPTVGLVTASAAKGDTLSGSDDRD